MKKLFVILLVALVAFIGYGLFKPDRFAPQRWTPPAAPADEPATQSEVLMQAQRLAEGIAHGPEDVAVDREGRLYAGYEDGTIRRFDAEGNASEVFATTNGRPLGLAFTNHAVVPARDTAAGRPPANPDTFAGGAADTGTPRQTLVVADADKGLLAIDAEGGIRELASEASNKPFGFTDDVDIASDGTIYFTDASSKYGRDAYLADIMEHGGHGRLMQYDPRTGRVTVLLGGLQFANGVAVGPDDAYVLVTETGSYRVLRYWLTGDKAGQSEIFIDNLPGFPDGISYDARANIFWTALFAPRNAVLDYSADKPWLREILFALPEALQPAATHMGRVLGLDPQGNIVADLRDARSEAFAPITSVERAGDMLYLGSLTADAFARIDARAATAASP